MNTAILHEWHCTTFFFQNGEVLHWNGANINNKPTASIFGQSGNTAPPVSTLSTNLACPWLNSEAVKNRVEVENLMMKQPLPLNSLDTIGNSIVFGGKEIFGFKIWGLD